MNKPEVDKYSNVFHDLINNYPGNYLNNVQLY